MSSKDKFLGHLKTVMTHKYWVFHYCKMTGIPIAGITHDMSKFSPTEFWEGVKYYQGNRSPIEACKEINGYSEAWFHHKGRNKHHYEYWVDNLDCGGTPTKMPYRYAKELICDYIAAGRAYMGDDFTYQMELEWWYRKLEKPLAMHSCTKAFVTDVFIHLANGESERAVLSDKWLKEIYWMTNYCDNW